MQVWAILMDLEKWPEWTNTVRSIEQVGRNHFGMGSCVRITPLTRGADDWTVTSWQPYRGFTWSRRSFGLVIRTRYTVVPAGIGTKATILVRFDGPLAPLAAFLAKRTVVREMEMEAVGLKKRAERKVPHSK